MLPVTVLGEAVVVVYVAKSGSVPHSKVTSVDVAPTAKTPFNVEVVSVTDVAALVVAETEDNADGEAPINDPPRDCFKA
jgi:hypothetical protein